MADAERSHCLKCDDHSGLQTELRYIKLLVDEREKQNSIATRAQELAINLAREQIDHRLTGMNEFQKRMDRLEGTFATKTELKALERLIYIGIGIALAAQVLVKFIKW